jgi:hypothetical protein
MIKMEALKTTLKLVFKMCKPISIRKCFVDAEEENAAAVGFKIKQEIF